MLLLYFEVGPNLICGDEEIFSFYQSLWLGKVIKETICCFNCYNTICYSLRQRISLRLKRCINTRWNPFIEQVIFGIKIVTFYFRYGSDWSSHVNIPSLLYSYIVICYRTCIISELFTEKRL